MVVLTGQYPRGSTVDTCDIRFRFAVEELFDQPGLTALTCDHQSCFASRILRVYVKIGRKEKSQRLLVVFGRRPDEILRIELQIHTSQFFPQLFFGLAAAKKSQREQRTEDKPGGFSHQGSSPSALDLRGHGR